jgi:hypothetical protein
LVEEAAELPVDGPQLESIETVEKEEDLLQ